MIQPQRNCISKSKRLWWVRHAPVKSVLDPILYGTLNVSADLSNKAPFRVLSEQLPTEAIWLITPLRRTGQTRDAIAAAYPHGQKLPDPLYESAFIEQNFGHWQGQSYAVLARTQEPRWRQFWQHPDTETPPGGESFAALAERVAAGITARLAAHSESHFVIISHAGPIRAAVGLALGLSPAQMLQLVVDPLSLTCLDYIPTSQGAVWRVEKMNAPFLEPILD